MSVTCVASLMPGRITSRSSIKRVITISMTLLSGRGGQAGRLGRRAGGRKYNK